MIESKELRFTYQGMKQAVVKGLSFAIEPGEIFGFLGPSGAGKSTTQKILTGLLRGYQGRVCIMDRELAQWGRALYERIGVSFEFPNHFLKLTGRENLQFFRELYEGETETPETLLDWLDLREAADQLAANYSKGMKNRLTLARALLNRPRLLFLDEPTEGLDPVNARRVKDLIREKREQGVTVFLTTHNMTVADELCDRVAFIVDGEIRLIDSPRALRVAHSKKRLRVEYRQEGDLQQREFDLEGIGDNGEFLTLLRQYPIETIHTQESTLEDIFIEVTGQRLQ